MCWHVMDGESRSFLVFAWALLAVFQSSHFHLPPSSSSLNTTAALGLYPSRITQAIYLGTYWFYRDGVHRRVGEHGVCPLRSARARSRRRHRRGSTEPVSYQQSPQSTGSWHVVVLSHRHRRAHNQMLTSPCRCVPRRRLKDSTRRPMNTGAKSNPSPRCEQHQPALPEKPPTTCSRWKSH